MAIEALPPPALTAIPLPPAFPFCGRSVDFSRGSGDLQQPVWEESKDTHLQIKPNEMLRLRKARKFQKLRLQCHHSFSCSWTEGAQGASGQPSAMAWEAGCVHNQLLPCNWRNYPCTGQNYTSHGTGLCWGSGGCASPQRQCQEVIWWPMTAGCCKQQCLPHLQKGIIKVSVIMIPIIAKLQQQLNYHCFQHVIFWGYGLEGRHGLSAIVLIAAKKENTCCVPQMVEVDKAALLSGMTLELEELKVMSGDEWW